MSICERLRHPEFSTLFVNRRHSSGFLTSVLPASAIYVNMVPDFRISDTGIWLLTLHFNMSKAGYVEDALSCSMPKFKRKLLLLLIEDRADLQSLAQVQKQFLSHGYAVMCAFEVAEVGVYLEALSLVSNNFVPFGDVGSFSSNSHVLGGIKSLGTSDIAALQRNFTSLGDLLRAKECNLSAIPGIGKTKVLHILRACSHPFLVQCAARDSVG